MMAIDKKQLERAAAINLDRAWIASERHASQSARQRRFLSIAAGTAESKRMWFVIRVASGTDKAVHNLLLAAGIQSWLPIYTQQMAARKSAPKIMKNVLACRGYLFVFVVPGAESWAGLAAVKGVETILGDGKKPLPVDDKNINRFMDMLETESAMQGDKAKAASLFKEGEAVRIVDGPFASYSVLVMQCFEKGRALIDISIFGRSTAVEMDLDQFEKV